MLFLSEAALLGMVGSLLGLAGGIFLARMLIGAVSKTISSLYVLVSVREIAVTPAMLGVAIVLGLGSVLLAAWLPAAAAARMDPIRALRAGSIIEQSAELSSAWSWAGIASLLLAAIFSAVALITGPPWIGFGAAFFVLTGFSFLVPGTARRFSVFAARILPPFHRRWMEARLAAANVSRALARNSVTIAALASAVAMAIGVSVMVFSFRQTVETWIGQTLVADLFVAPASNEVAGPVSFIPPAAVEFLEKHSAVEAVDTFRDARVPMGEKTIALAVVRGADRRQFRFLRGDAAAIMKRFHGTMGVIVSESFARKNGVGDGDVLNLTTPSGPRAFPIAGTFYDYTSEQGVVFISSKNFVAIWNDDRISSVAVYLKADAAVEALKSQFRAAFSETGQFLTLSNRELRTRVFEIFDQTFAVTYVLRSIAVIVAIVGICLTLTTLITERSRELAVFRAIGGSAPQLRRLLLWESGMIGLLSALIGLASGLCLSLVLTGVINRAFFGWTIQMAFPWSALAWTPVWIVAAALLAGVWPAWRAGKVVVAEALRSE